VCSYVTILYTISSEIALNSNSYSIIASALLVKLSHSCCLLSSSAVTMKKSAFFTFHKLKFHPFTVLCLHFLLSPLQLVASAQGCRQRGALALLGVVDRRSTLALWIREGVWTSPYDTSAYFPICVGNICTVSLCQHPFNFSSCCWDVGIAYNILLYLCTHSSSHVSSFLTINMDIPIT